MKHLIEDTLLKRDHWSRSRNLVIVLLTSGGVLFLTTQLSEQAPSQRGLYSVVVGIALTLLLVSSVGLIFRLQTADRSLLALQEIADEYSKLEYSALSDAELSICIRTLTKHANLYLADSLSNDLIHSAGSVRGQSSIARAMDLLDQTPSDLDKAARVDALCKASSSIARACHLIAHDIGLNSRIAG